MFSLSTTKGLNMSENPLLAAQKMARTGKLDSERELMALEAIADSLVRIENLIRSATFKIPGSR